MLGKISQLLKGMLAVAAASCICLGGVNSPAYPSQEGRVGTFLTARCKTVCA